MIEEIIPNLDARFRTLADREHRAMAGLSRGNGHALTIPCGNLDTFSYRGVFSRAPYKQFDVNTVLNDIFAKPDEFNKRVHRFYWNTG
jgi:enterochelin esterase-like enzyme